MEFEFMTAGTALPPCMPLPPVLLRLPASSTAKVMSSMMRCMVFLLSSKCTPPFLTVFSLFYHVCRRQSIKILYTFSPLVSFRCGWYNQRNDKQEVCA